MQQETSHRTTLLRDEATVAGRFLLIVLAVGVLIWLVLRVQVVAIGAMFGLALAALLWPIVARLRRDMPQVLAVLLCVLAFLGIFGVGLWLLSVQLLQTLPDISTAAWGGIQSLIEWAQNLGPGLPHDIVTQLTNWLGGLASGAGDIAAAGLGLVSTFATVVVLIIFVLVFALLGGDELAASAVDMLPDRWRRRAGASARALARTARAWLFAASMCGLVDATLIATGLAILGVPMPVSIGMLAFFAAFIPTIGGLFSGVVAVSVAFFIGGLPTALWTLLLVVIVLQLHGSVLEPLLLSKAMSFHPLVTFLLVATGGMAFGFVGLLLTVPIVGMTVAVVKAWRNPDGDPQAQSSS